MIIISKIVRYVFFAVILYITFTLVSDISRGKTNMQWDFGVYYYSAEAQQAGLDPYAISDLAEISGKNIWLGYVYPPVTLPFFKLFTVFDFETAFQLWLIAKIIAAVFLFFLWTRYFLVDKSIVLFILFFLFAYDAAVYWDIKAGNISMFEQVILWCAFLLFMKKKAVWFAGLIVVISLFKITPILFLFLLPLSNIAGKWRWFGGALAVFLSIMGISYFLDPGMFDAFLTQAMAVDERADDFNYGTLALMKDVYDFLLGGSEGFLPRYTPVLLYILAVIAVIGTTARRYIRDRSAMIRWDNRLLIFVACAVYVLVLPRFKCYSFILLIVPSYIIIRAYISKHSTFLLVMLFLIPVNTALPHTDTINRLFLYSPLYMAFAVWMLYMMCIRERKTEVINERFIESTAGSDSPGPPSPKKSEL